jgi:hypothetical protein
MPNNPIINIKFYNHEQSIYYPHKKAQNKQTNELKWMVLLLSMAILPFGLKAQIHVTTNGDVSIKKNKSRLWVRRIWNNACKCSWF